MTSIERIGAKPSAATARRAPPGGAAFAVPEDTARPEVPGVAVATGATAINLIALQETSPDHAARDRSARRRGQAILAALTALQRALLDGSDPGAARACLESLADHLPEPASSGLATVLAAIALRARIELARRA